MKVKIFEGYPICKLEEELNNWLNELNKQINAGTNIKYIKQSGGVRDGVVVSIFYEVN